MSSINSEALINKFPQDRETIKRLLSILNDSEAQKRQKELTLKRLFDLTSPRSEVVLAQILNHLTKIGVLQRIVRVESRNMGGLEDFSSITEIPEVIHDWRRDIDMYVTPDDINILYKVISAIENGSSHNG